MRRCNLLQNVFTVVLMMPTCQVFADGLPFVTGVELQPLVAHVERVVQALELSGAPLSKKQVRAIRRAVEESNEATAVKALQEVLDPLCLVGVNINPESRVKVASGEAARELIEQGWQVFLVKVHNEAGVTAPLRVQSPNAERMHDAHVHDAEPPQTITQRDVRNRWLDVSFYDNPPLHGPLSGLPVEYRILELYSRDRGQREAKLQFDVGQGTQDLGFRNEISLLFNCRPSVAVKFEVLDDDGAPTTGQFTIRDQRGRVYPARSRRLAPDFFFHDQIYREHGEIVLLPAGKYTVSYTRGPEYLLLRREIEVGDRAEQSERFRMKRWIHLAGFNWFSGDHHVHAAGCAHYSSPTQGVGPADMMRHLVGEDLNVGCVLTWGPCWYHQRQYFEGKVNALSTPRNIMRYDVEVSGFPSSHGGHIILLRLENDEYPGASRIEQWPSWNLPILQWGKQQGGVVGYAHSGWGLAVADTKLPTLAMPAFDGIGANDFIVNVTHDACDFISSIDTPANWELNIWYHTLNCGFTTRISGETDFPCIYGERVGLGRVYVKLNDDGPIDFDRWVEGVRDGRSYCCDGLTHLFDFEINGLGVGEPGQEGRASVLGVEAHQPLRIKCKAAGLLDEQPQHGQIAARALDQQPYWHIERARLSGTRQIQVELIVNGQVVDTKPIEADGSIEELQFDFTPTRSCWIALRVFPAAHTNPIFVEVDGKPIRASKQSAQWCLNAVDRCWEAKSPLIRAEEIDAAAASYDHARKTYQRILDEAFDDR